MATQLIGQEEAEKLQLLPFGKKHPVRVMLEDLKRGQYLRISREDFNWKGKTPNYFCIRIAKVSKARFKIYKEAYRTGWVVKRVE